MKREHCKRGHLFAGDNIVKRKAFRVVIDPIAAAIFGGGK